MESWKVWNESKVNNLLRFEDREAWNESYQVIDKNQECCNVVISRHVVVATWNTQKAEATGINPIQTCEEYDTVKGLIATLPSTYFV